MDALIHNYHDLKVSTSLARVYRFATGHSVFCCVFVPVLVRAFVFTIRVLTDLGLTVGRRSGMKGKRS